MAVKNVTFEVTANTQNAQASLAALIKQLDDIKKNSTISFTQSTGNIDAQIKALSTKLDKLAKDNQKRIDSETKSVTDNQKTQTNAVKSDIDEQKKAYENFAKYNADVLKKEQKAFQESQAAKVKAARDDKKAEREQIVQQGAADKTSNKKQVESTAYAQVSESVKQLNARSRELGAQLIQLDQAGQKNSSTYKALAKEYATVKAEADKASAALKQLNSNSNLQPSAQKLGGLAGAINFISRAVANSSANFVRLQNVIARTGVALGAVSIGAAVLSFGRAALDAAKNYEVLNVSFGTLIGNTTLAGQKIKELRQFAAETPFTTEDVFQASRTLLGYGVTVGQLIPTIQKLGDVAGGVGVPLERVALVFGQVRAAGRLYGQDLLQLVQLGFNPLSEIARTTGESFDSLKDKMRKGQITFDDVNKAFITATSEGGKFYNLTNALANTTTAQLARLNEEWTILLTQVGQGLLPAFNGLINIGRILLEFFSNLPKTIKDNATVFTFLTAATTALTAALFANSLNLVSNSVKTVFNTAAKVANRTATALMAGANIIATQGLTAQTLAQAGLTTATRIGTAAMNAFKIAVASNPIGLIITLLTTAAAAWYAFSDAVDTASDNFIDADEALNELAVNSAKSTNQEIAALDKLMEVSKDVKKSLGERQKALDEINQKYKTSIKLTGDEKKDVILLKDSYIDLTEAIKQSNKEKASGEIKAKLEAQLAEIRLEILNTSSEQGVEITPKLILDDKEIQSGFEKTKQIIQSNLDSANFVVPNQLEQSLDKLFSVVSLSPAVRASFTAETGLNEAFTNRANAVESLNVQLDKLIKTYGIIAAVNQEVGVTPDTNGVTGIDDDKAKERLRRLKEFENELLSLLDRIRKNNEDLRRQFIELNFIDAADFEEEVVKLQQLDRINEETVNREIDREIESVRQREITEQQKTTLIAQLEVIRNQEQQKRAFALQERLYEIERDGTIARRELALELGALYDQLISDRAQRELESLNELRDQLDDFYSDIFQDDPFAKGKFITAPRIEFGGTEFQFEDITQAPLEAIEELRKSISELNAAPSDLTILSEAELEARNQLIDEFNAKYGTTLDYVQNEFDLQAELSKEYEKRVKQAKELYNEQNKAPRRQNIFQFSRGVQERGQEDPFVTAIEENQRKFIESSNAAEQRELERINNERNARILLIQQTATEENKELQIKIVNAEFDKKVEETQVGFFKNRKERLKKDAQAIDANNEEQKKVINEERDARLQAIFDISQAVLDFTATFIDAQIQQTDAAIAQQQRRVDAAKEIADKGNVVLLKAEQERLDTLNRQRASFVRQQQSLAVIEIALNTAIAVSKAASQPGSPFTIIALLAAMAVGFAQARAQAQSAATFAKGGYTGDGHQFQEAGTVHKGEFVMNAQKTRQYRPLLEAIHSGRHPELGKSVNDKIFVVNSKSSDERLERIERAIREQQGMQLSIDENGINGIVSRISYKQQRINNRAR